LMVHQPVSSGRFWSGKAFAVDGNCNLDTQLTLAHLQM
jgi:hypothetical protein